MTENRNGILEPGQQVAILTDLYPAKITPLPEGVPPTAKIRAIITDHSMTVAWSMGKQGTETMVGRVDVPLEPSQTTLLNHTGGRILAASEGRMTASADEEPLDVVYRVERGSGCSCGAAGLKNWHPFPDVFRVNRTFGAGSPPQAGSTPTRYTRA